MAEQYEHIITEIYRAFNERDIDKVFSFMDENVHWPNGWEGGYVEGHSGVRDYWTRQWKEINPRVDPVSLSRNESGQIEVVVHQVAKDMQGNVLFDGIVKHIYTMQNGVILTMEIKSETNH